MLYNAFLSCPLPRLNQRNPLTDVMSYKCYQSIWVSHTETSREIQHLSINCQHGINYYYVYSSYACSEVKHKDNRLKTACVFSITVQHFVGRIKKNHLISKCFNSAAVLR